MNTCSFEQEALGGEKWIRRPVFLFHPPFSYFFSYSMRFLLKFSHIFNPVSSFFTQTLRQACPPRRNQDMLVQVRIHVVVSCQRFEAVRSLVGK